MPTTHYIWDVENDSYLMEKDGAGATTAVYANEPVQYGKLISQRRGNTTSYYHFDAQQSTRQLTDQNQNVTDEYTYTAFGETVAASEMTTNPFKYIGIRGYYLDTETAHLYVRGRTYSPTHARWLSPDPLLLIDGKELSNEGLPDVTVNLYLYGSNSPITLSDPSGYTPYNICVALISASCLAECFVRKMNRLACYAICHPLARALCATACCGEVTESCTPGHVQVGLQGVICYYDCRRCGLVRRDGVYYGPLARPRYKCPDLSSVTCRRCD